MIPALLNFVIFRQVKYLVKKIVLLLKEYLCSGDVQEASRCLVDLEVPHFHHELVYEVGVLSFQLDAKLFENRLPGLCEKLFSICRCGGLLFTAVLTH